VPNVNIKKVRLNMPKIPNTTNAIIQIIWVLRLSIVIFK
jgi:hypothetical protein